MDRIDPVLRRASDNREPGSVPPRASRRPGTAPAPAPRPTEEREGDDVVADWTYAPSPTPAPKRPARELRGPTPHAF